MMLIYIGISEKQRERERHFKKMKRVKSTERQGMSKLQNHHFYANIRIVNSPMDGEGWRGQGIRFERPHMDLTTNDVTSCTVSNFHT